MNNTLEMVLFAIDDDKNLHSVAKFLRYVDTAKAMGKLIGTVQFAIGKWNGEYEQSYLMYAKDFDEHVRDSGYVNDQDCFLRIPGSTRQPCILDYQGKKYEPVGKMRQVDTEPEGDFTYVDGNYWELCDNV